MRHFTALSIAIVVAFAAVANAALINVDFGPMRESNSPTAPFIPMSGAAIIGATSDVWNTAATSHSQPIPETGSNIALFDSFDNPTSVTMSYSRLPESAGLRRDAVELPDERRHHHVFNAR